MTDNSGGVDSETEPDAPRSETLTDPAPITGFHPGGPRREDPPFPAVAAAIRSHYAEDSSGHGIAHVWRVFRLTQRFAEELGADRTVVGCAALVHDLHRVLEDGTGRDPAETTAEVARALEQAGVDDKTVGAVTHCVAVHDDLALRGEDPTPETVEAEILRDADNLDAMGAIGIARAFAFGGAHGNSLWDETGQEYSSLYHFEDKLLRLREELHTEPARQLAENRHAALERFHEQFRAEWHGNA